MLISMVSLREFPVPQGSVQSFIWKVESNFVRNKVFVWVPPCAEYTNVIIISFQSFPPSDRVVDDICHPLTLKLPLTLSDSRFSVCLVNYSACLMDPTESIGSSTITRYFVPEVRLFLQSFGSNCWGWTVPPYWLPSLYQDHGFLPRFSTEVWDNVVQRFLKGYNENFPRYHQLVPHAPLSILTISLHRCLCSFLVPLRDSCLKMCPWKPGCN